MPKHLSLRLPWHDRGWDGHVCDHPTANVYCSGEYGLKAHEIRDKKLDDEEERLRGQPCHSIKPGDYRPPCLRTINTFGGVRALEWRHQPKEFLSTAEYPIDPIA